jgi:hypothetical protein
VGRSNPDGATLCSWSRADDAFAAGAAADGNGRRWFRRRRRPIELRTRSMEANVVTSPALRAPSPMIMDFRMWASSVIASTDLRLAPRYTAHQGQPQWLRHRVQNVMDECSSGRAIRFPLDGVDWVRKRWAPAHYSYGAACGRLIGRERATRTTRVCPSTRVRLVLRCSDGDMDQPATVAFQRSVTT